MKSIQIMQTNSEGRTIFGYCKAGLYHIYIGHENPVASWCIDSSGNFDLNPAEKSKCPFADEMENAIMHMNQTAKIIWGNNS